MTTVAELTTLIDTNLADTGSITGNELRTVFAELSLILEELIAARDGKASVSEAVLNQHQFDAVAKIVGRYYDTALFNAGFTNVAGAAGRMELTPYYVERGFNIDRLGVLVTTAVASALGRVVIYGADSDGWPGAKLYESADLNFSTTGLKEATLSFTFASETQYWLGQWHSSTATLRHPGAGCGGQPFGYGTSNTATGVLNGIRRIVTWGGAAPDPWTFNVAELIAITLAATRFRIAA